MTNPLSPLVFAMCGKRAGQVRKNGTTSTWGHVFTEDSDRARAGFFIPHRELSAGPARKEQIQQRRNSRIVNHGPQEACRSLCIMINLANTILRFCNLIYPPPNPLPSPFCESKRMKRPVNIFSRTMLLREENINEWKIKFIFHFLYFN